MKSASAKLLETSELDLSTCAQEPIHIPGSIQPRGVLLVVDGVDLTILQASANTEFYFGISVHSLLGSGLATIFGQASAEFIAQSAGSSAIDQNPLYLETVTSGANGANFYAIAHRFHGQLVIEFEPTASERSVVFHDTYANVRRFLAHLRNAQSVDDMALLTAQAVREMTGFGRVLVYRFDADWNGHVIAEARDDEYDSYLDLWFPASDIPSQARKLYELNRLRLIADAAYEPVPLVPALNPATQSPTDLSFAVLRSVSPIHLEYLKNMRVSSSMSISLLTSEGRLWGLIACHHHTPRFVSFEARGACDLLGQAVSTQLELHEQRSEYELRIHRKSITTRLLGHMANQTEFLNGLHENPDELLSFGGAAGAAIVDRERCVRIGNCPDENEVWRIVDWLVERGREEIFSTDGLPSLISDGEVFRAAASGILAISISKIYRSYILWFRPEFVQTVQWAGDPRKPAEGNADHNIRISPRKSFEAWKQILHGRSQPWHQAELEAAGELRNAIIGVVLRKAEELAQMSEELQRSNRELEAFSYSVSHDLRAPFRHIVGYSEILRQTAAGKLDSKDLRYLDIIIQSAEFAGTLVDNLLSFSQVGRAKLKIQRVAVSVLVAEVIRDLNSEVQDRRVTWDIGPLPEVKADVVMFRLVWQNLLQNALKYTRPKQEAIIRIRATSELEEMIFEVKDNGIGFEQQYAGKLFGIFQRLHRMEDFEGTGIGLANVRRIISRHRGRTWAQGQPGEGATFYFTLPHTDHGSESA